jgi:HK97 family phage prohead protease
MTATLTVVEAWPSGLGPLEIRSNGTVGAVSFPRRTVTVVAVPYETDAEIFDGERTYMESFARGAFAGVQTRTNRIKVNRDHDHHRPVGKALELHPTRAEGLVAELRISATTLGDETLALADDGVLDASIGFGLKAGDAEWSDGRRRRTINRAFLDHIALVADPAYDTANVIDVRHHPAGTARPQSATPLLDDILAQRRAVQYADLYAAGLPPQTPQ